MEQTVSIEVDLDSLEHTHQIVGNIYFIIDYHRFFPDEGWSDFVVIILSWWIQSLKGLIISSAGSSYIFDFMDGTPMVLGKKIDSNQIEMSFCNDNDRREIEFIAICRLDELKDALLSVSKKVLRALDRKKWNSSEIDELRDLTLSLERYP